MSDAESLKAALRPEKRTSRREKRAVRERAKALSPVRILVRILGIPIVAAGIATSIYIRTSPYEPSDALRHLIARVGCGPAEAMALAPAYEGEIGYHLHNDSDGDGVACEGWGLGTGTASAPAQTGRRASGAKFLKPGG